MYWQKRFDRENPDKQLEDEITKIHIENKDYGYRRVYRELRNRKIFVNKKKVQRIMQKLCFQVTSFTRKSRRYNSYKGNVGKIAPNRINRRFNTSVPHQKITTDTTEFKYYEGLPYLNDFYLEVHYEGTLEQDESIQRVLAERGKTVYATAVRAGAILVDNGNLKLLGDVKVFGR